MQDHTELNEGDEVQHNDGTERYVLELLEGFGTTTVKLGVKSDDGTIMATSHGQDRIDESNADEWRLIDE